MSDEVLYGIPDPPTENPVRMKRTYHPNLADAWSRIKKLKRNGFRVRPDPVFSHRNDCWCVYYTHEDPDKVE